MAPPSTPDHFPSREMFDTLIRIEVGSDEEKQSFDVYRGVLCFYSGYFKAALNGRWKESQDEVVRLPEDEPKMFQLLTHWIHTRCFFESTLDPSTLMSFTMLAKVWVLADVVDIPMLRNEAVHMILKKMKAERKCMSEEAIEYIHDSTVDDSALRRLTCKSITMAMRRGFAGYKLVERDLNQPCDLAWAQDVLKLYPTTDQSRSEKVFWEWITLEYPCQWHVHPDGIDCAAATEG